MERCSGNCWYVYMKAWEACFYSHRTNEQISAISSTRPDLFLAIQLLKEIINTENKYDIIQLNLIQYMMIKQIMIYIKLNKRKRNTNDTQIDKAFDPI